MASVRPFDYGKHNLLGVVMCMKNRFKTVTNPRHILIGKPLTTLSAIIWSISHIGHIWYPDLLPIKLCFTVTSNFDIKQNNRN